MNMEKACSWGEPEILLIDVETTTTTTKTVMGLSIL